MLHISGDVVFSSGVAQRLTLDLTTLPAFDRRVGYRLHRLVAVFPSETEQVGATLAAEASWDEVTDVSSGLSAASNTATGIVDSFAYNAVTGLWDIDWTAVGTSEAAELDALAYSREIPLLTRYPDFDVDLHELWLRMIVPSMTFLGDGIGPAAGLLQASGGGYSRGVGFFIQDDLNARRLTSLTTTGDAELLAHNTANAWHEVVFRADLTSSKSAFNGYAAFSHGVSAESKTTLEETKIDGGSGYAGTVSDLRIVLGAAKRGVEEIANKTDSFSLETAQVRKPTAVAAVGGAASVIRSRRVPYMSLNLDFGGQARAGADFGYIVLTPEAPVLNGADMPGAIAPPHWDGTVHVDFNMSAYPQADVPDIPPKVYLALEPISMERYAAVTGGC